MFMASCGTTVLGSFDDLESVADICKRYNVWMHVDVRIVLQIYFYNADTS